MLLFIILILSKIAISIHLMLLFIGVETLETGEVMEISIHLMLLFILAQLVKENNYLLFQYISCYCLSGTNGDNANAEYKFQYISCYCLSRWFCWSN